MKKVLLISLIALLGVMFTACDKKQHAIDNLSDFVEKVEKNAPEYTDEDWAEVNEEYEALIAEIDKYKYSKDERKRIGALKGRFTGIKTKYSINKFMDDIEKAAQEVKGAIEGFTEGIMSGDESQKE